MSFEKSKLRMDIIQSIGVDFDDKRESAVKVHNKCLGAQEAAAKIGVNILKLVSSADSLLSSGKVAEAIKKGDLAVLELVKTQVARAVACCTEFGAVKQQEATKMSGKIEALEESVKHLAKMRDKTKENVAQIATALASGHIQQDGGDLLMMDQKVKRPKGVRPKMSLKQRRLAEEAAEKADSGKNGEKGADLDSMTPEQLEQYLLQG